MSEFKVLMVKAIKDDVSCRRCTSGLLSAGAFMLPTKARAEIDKVYRGWHCGCRRPPESHVIVHVQGPELQYLELCAGCASDLTGVPKEDLISPAVAQISDA